jgi:hypothetical protein
MWKAFDVDAGKDAARDVREYFIPDFSKWKDDNSYQITFERLLRDLKQETDFHRGFRHDPDRPACR